MSYSHTTIEKQQILEKIDALLNKSEDPASVNSTEDGITVTIWTSYSKAVSAFYESLKKCLQDAEKDIPTYDMADSFSRWLDINFQKASISSLQESLILCGVNKDSIDHNKESITNALIKHGISPHFIPSQITVIHDKGSNMGDDCLRVNSFKAVYKSHVIGNCKIISESYDEESKSECKFHVNLALLSSLSQEA